MSVAASAGTPAGERPSIHRIGGEALRFSPDDGATRADLRLAVGGEADRQRRLAHLLRLSGADRRMRFMRIMSDEALESHVAALDLGRDVRLTLLDPVGSMVALAEGFIYMAGACREMEVAFSTDAPWRRLGLARFLWTAMTRRARDHDVERVILHCDSRNAGMRGLLSSVGASTHVETTEVHATWPVAASC